MLASILLGILRSGRLLCSSHLASISFCFRSTSAIRVDVVDVILSTCAIRVDDVVVSNGNQLEVTFNVNAPCEGRGTHAWRSPPATEDAAHDDAAVGGGHERLVSWCQGSGVARVDARVEQSAMSPQRNEKKSRYTTEGIHPHCKRSTRGY